MVNHFIHCPKGAVDTVWWLSYFLVRFLCEIVDEFSLHYLNILNIIARFIISFKNTVELTLFDC